MTILEVRNLSKVYPNGTQALKSVTFSVEKGEFLAVIGLSGSGKSTLLRCINRLIEPTSGTILFEGQDVTHIKGEELRRYRQKIGMIFQQFNLIGRYSVLHNVLMGSLGSIRTIDSLLGRFPASLRQLALQNLEIVGIADKAHVRADSLSGGQQQRVAIARALMQEPLMLLADEPVASLDPATSHSVMRYLGYINREIGTTIICNLHFLSLVREYATRVIALKEGEVVFEGAPTDITEEWFRHIYGDEAVEVEIQ
ncbi:MAG: phosphonate ABC transporter ATP-binding protein [Bacteroidota bacterium]|nr:phosphonate ABC transporter ATP-binding protein [Candidatus Kapabacteria bacterium]MCS7302288.1 phosphonate ABC transporter ATP-binding protein [Candidatus Kapabacteria bacterium]MCX7936297.1 phosphonate ABC transporter ATP-binding protein [Chlorobiota bacterium]MDW8074421.1 phosphonate ABC transporter ATP-binding protein [Bacteroidota bacterium]MDW8271103.1 phosphonate ABC transporter ATP-binding protein [Bacteroidota bacterium]